MFIFSRVQLVFILEDGGTKVHDIDLSLDYL